MVDDYWVYSGWFVYYPEGEASLLVRLWLLVWLVLGLSWVVVVEGWLRLVEGWAGL